MAEKKSPRGSEFWQIIFPTLVGAVLMLALGIWFGLTGSAGNISRFAHISTVLLSIPVFIVSLVFGLVLVGLIYLVGRLLGGIPPVAEKLLHFLDRIRDTAGRASRSVAKLVIEPTAKLAVFQRKSDPSVEEIKLND
jgi:ABC-type dipeptide/oligopeptide/nickel transport system permease component